MKKGHLNFLGRKNQSLFDTNRPIKIQEMDNGLPENLERMLDLSAIPETGTAKVRSRPTVKHHIASSESLHGFAVPTPTVPLFNGVSSGGDQLSNGSVISMSESVGDIFVPPPPSVAPPPPPTEFILPPPDFLGDLDSPTMAIFKRPSMPPPKPPSQPLALEEDFTLLKPPPMTPPKPPSTSSSAFPPITTPPPSMIPELPDCPRFAPPKPPSEKQQKPGKIPPPKPNRLSSISAMDSLIPPTSPAATPQMSTPSSFNPQNTAKLYNTPKSSILSGHGDCDTRPKQILLLQDSRPVPVQLNGKASPTPPSKPIRGTNPGTLLDKEPKGNLQANGTSETPELPPKSEAKSLMAILQEKNHVPSFPQVSPQLSKKTLTPVPSDIDGRFVESPSQGKFSPLIDRKLRNLKGEGSSTSPLALLQAAKDREKHKSSVLLENGPQSSASIQHHDSSPNSFVVTPRSTSTSSTSSQKGLEEDSKLTVNSSRPTPTTQTQALHNAHPVVRSPLQAPSTPALSGISTAMTPAPVSRLAMGKQNVEQATPSFDYTQSQPNQPEMPMTLLPPPPEFANFDFGGSMDSPPDFPPPDPPAKKAPLPTVKPYSAVAPAPPPDPPAKKAPLPTVKPYSAVAPAPPPDPPAKKAPLPTAQPVYSALAPAPPPKVKSHAAPPKTFAPVQDTKTQVSYQTLPKVPDPKPLPAVSESQATLLSILQKKMLEMDHKISPKKDTESSSDEWGSPLSEEETKFPFASRTLQQNSKKTTKLDMRELETKVAKKLQDQSSATSNGKHHGMTFTVRPGTKQPITLVSKGEPS